MNDASVMPTLISPLNGASVTSAQCLLRAGALVAVPTETVYGLAADAFNPAAVAKIFAVKRRPSFDPLIIHVGTHLKSVASLADAGIINQDHLTPAARATTKQLIEAFWPGPLTLVLPKHENVPGIVTSGLERVAVRMPAHKGLQQVLLTSGLYLAAPSANTFGHVSPTTAQHVYDDLNGLIPLILDAGPCDFGVESTVVSVMDDGRISILRRGALSAESLFRFENVKLAAHTPQAPGMLTKHYAPVVPLLALTSESDIDPQLQNAKQLLKNKKRIGVLLPTPNDVHSDSIQQYFTDADLEFTCLADDGDSLSAARVLFAEMRRFERTKDLMIAVLPTDDSGLWPAVRDRLQKAANHWLCPST